MPDVTVLVTELVGVVTTIVDVAVVVSVVKSHARYPPVSYRSIARLRAATVISHLLADVESFRRPSLSHWIVPKDAVAYAVTSVTILFRNTSDFKHSALELYLSKLKFMDAALFSHSTSGIDCAHSPTIWFSWCLWFTHELGVPPTSTLMYRCVPISSHTSLDCRAVDVIVLVTDDVIDDVTELDCDVVAVDDTVLDALPDNVVVAVELTVDVAEPLADVVPDELPVDVAEDVALEVTDELTLPDCVLVSVLDAELVALVVALMVTDEDTVEVADVETLEDADVVTDAVAVDETVDVIVEVALALMVLVPVLVREVETLLLALVVAEVDCVVVIVDVAVLVTDEVWETL